jgi:hypothetical protein
MVCVAQSARKGALYRITMTFMRHHAPNHLAYPTLKAESIRLKNLFKLFVSFLKDADLIGCEIIAIDGTCCAKSPELVSSPL